METETRLVLAHVETNGVVTIVTPDGHRDVEAWLDEGWTVLSVHPLGDGARVLLQLEREEGDGAAERVGSPDMQRSQTAQARTMFSVPNPKPDPHG